MSTLITLGIAATFLNFVGLCWDVFFNEDENVSATILFGVGTVMASVGTAILVLFGNGGQ